MDTPITSYSTSELEDLISKEADAPEFTLEELVSEYLYRQLSKIIPNYQQDDAHVSFVKSKMESFQKH